jgi:putative ABC transport system permease protein
MLARAVEREGEIAVRVALGASPSRVIRLFLVESATVAALGGMLGAALAVWSLPLIQTMDPGVLAGWRELQVDGWVLFYTTVLLLITTLACGLFPAMRWLRPAAGPLAGAARLTAGIGRSRVRQAVIVGEVAVSVVLLLATGLLLRSFERLSRVDPGFDPRRVVAATIFLSSRYDQNARQVDFFDRLLERLSTMPGVVAAGAVTTLPMNPIGIDYDLPFAADGKRPINDAEQEQVDFRSASPGYFRALGVPLLRGRWFGSKDREEAPRVVIVNQTLARRYFAGANPVGREVWVGGGIGRATVVGVVGAVRHRNLEMLPRPELYVPIRQYPHGGLTVVVRAAGDPDQLTAAIKSQVYALDPDQPISDLVTLPQLIDDSVSPRRFTLLLLGGFALLAVVLAAIGVYGVIAYTVSQRTKEIGIRIALGAQAAQIRRAVSQTGLLMAGAGVLLGSAAGLMLTRLLASELYEVSPHDPFTFVAAAGLILVVAWTASEIPALRTTRVDPVIALRSE